MFKKRYSQKFSVRIFIGLNILTLAVIWFIAFWRYGVSEDFIPLHYTIYFGFDRFGPKFDIFLFPTLGTVILILNSIVSRVVIENNKLWKILTLCVTLVMELILLSSLVLAVLKDLS